MYKRKRSNSTTQASGKRHYQPSANKMLLKAMERKVAQNTEKKGVDTSLTGNIVQTTTTNANIVVANLISPGTNSWNRVGRKVHLKSLRVYGCPDLDFGLSAANQAGGANFRMVVVWDKQPSGAAIPNFDQIFGTTAQDGTEAVDSNYDKLRYDVMGRYKILRDKTLTLNIGWSPLTGTGGVYTNRVNGEYIDEYIDLRGYETVYSGQSAPCTIADISSGALYVVFRGESTNPTISIVGFEGACRLRYTD